MHKKIFSRAKNKTVALSFTLISATTLSIAQSNLSEIGKNYITLTNSLDTTIKLTYLNSFSDQVHLSLAPFTSSTIKSDKAFWITNPHYKFGTIYLMHPNDSLSVSLSPESDIMLTSAVVKGERSIWIDIFRSINSRAGKSYVQLVLEFKRQGNAVADFTRLNQIFEARHAKELSNLNDFVSENNLTSTDAHFATQVLELELFSKKLTYIWNNKSLMVNAAVFKKEFENEYAKLKHKIHQLQGPLFFYKNLEYGYFVRHMQYQLGLEPFHGNQFQKPATEQLYNAVMDDKGLTLHRDLMLFLIVKEALTDKPEGNQNIINRFFSDCQSEPYKSYIKNILEVSQVGLKREEDVLIGNAPQTIAFNTLLTSLKGNIVYIDVWASWCLPCRREIPIEKELMATYASDPVRFVFISEDANVNAWKAASDQEELGSYAFNFLLPNFEQSSLRKRFKITSIQRYIIYGKDGQLLNANAPAPSDPALKKLLEQYMRE